MVGLDTLIGASKLLVLVIPIALLLIEFTGLNR